MKLAVVGWHETSLPEFWRGWHASCLNGAMFDTIKTKWNKPLVCSWCTPHFKTYAQMTLRHAVSHGICQWHKKLMLAKIRTQARQKQDIAPDSSCHAKVTPARQIV